MVNCWANLQGHSDSHLTKEVLQECWENGKNQMKNFGWVGNDVANELGVLEVRISPKVVYPAIAWVTRNRLVFVRA